MRPSIRSSQLVTRLRKKGRGVCTVGDGHNDASAMSSSDLSIAVLSGLEGKSASSRSALGPNKGAEAAKKKIEERLGHFMSSAALVSGVKGARARVHSDYLICRPTIGVLPELLEVATTSHEASRVLESQANVECWLQALDFKLMEVSIGWNLCFCL